MRPVVPAAAALLVAVCSSHCALTGLLTGQGNRGGLLLLCQLMQIHIHPGHARQLPPAFLIPACTRGLSGRPCLDWLLMKYLQVYMHSDHILVGRGGVGRGGAGRGRAGQGRAGQGRAGQGRAGARQDRAVQAVAGQYRTDWSRAG